MQAETLKRSSQKTETMQLIGLQGPESADAVDRALSIMPGVAQVSVSLADQKATITYDTAQVNVKHLQAAIKDAGFESLKPVHGEDGNCCGGCGG
ncbi:heavy-metal-associated domain-containing protein [Pusillimonas sp.]|uniref:heavy-metal-associated domain-containing protein n=1 Tax=Pusillimonas sp. TaxID=3040095 RepID=UPI0037CA96FF